MILTEGTAFLGDFDPHSSRMIAVFDQVELQRQPHRTLDRRAANLALALGSMSIAHGKWGAGNLDREEDLSTLSQVARIHIAADPARWDDAVLARFRRRHPMPFSHRALSASALS